MIRERNEIMAFSRDDIERIVRTVSRMQIVGQMFIGKFGDQKVRWTPDGGIEVITTYQEGEWADVHELPSVESVQAYLAEKPKKRRK